MNSLHPHTLGQSLALAARVMARVLDGASSTDALVETSGYDGSLRAAAHDLSFNALRAYGVVDSIGEMLLDKPVPDSLLRALIYVALAEVVAQLDDRPRAMHAVVHQAVEAASLLGRARAKGLVNAVLRAFLRDSTRLMIKVRSSEPGRWNHPQWWIDSLKSAYPESWTDILAQSNKHPLMCLRINIRHGTPQGYLSRLETVGICGRFVSGQAVLLDKPCGVDVLPGFSSGDVSIQDAGAQRAAELLDVRVGARVLDACAAPGGKAAHLLELVDCELVAMDVAPDRIRRVKENFTRLGLRAEVIVGDAKDAARRFPDKQFDRILADVPCTASGVVRRHPDMRWLRRESDIRKFVAAQSAILAALWQVLAPDGKLLYATCSVFPEENGLQVQAFLEQHIDADLLCVAAGAKGQILPTSENDGFYYAVIHKKP